MRRHSRIHWRTLILIGIIGSYNLILLLTLDLWSRIINLETIHIPKHWLEFLIAKNEVKDRGLFFPMAKFENSSILMNLRTKIEK